MTNEKSIDRELGELTGLVKVLTEKVDTLSNEFKTYRASNDEANRKDYKYLDDKIGGIEGRVSSIEETHRAEKASLVAKVKNKVGDLLVVTFYGLVIGFVGYYILEWIKSL